MTLAAEDLAMRRGRRLWWNNCLTTGSLSAASGQSSRSTNGLKRLSPSCWRWWLTWWSWWLCTASSSASSAPWWSELSILSSMLCSRRCSVRSWPCWSPWSSITRCNMWSAAIGGSFKARSSSWSPYSPWPEKSLSQTRTKLPPRRSRRSLASRWPSAWRIGSCVVATATWKQGGPSTQSAICHRSNRADPARKYPTCRVAVRRIIRVRCRHRTPIY